MSAWGNKDDIASPGTVDLSGLTVTGTGTFFANNYSVGDVIKFTTNGSAVIKSIANATSLTIVSNTEVTVGTLANTAYSVSQKPKEVIEGDATTTASEVYGVSVAEQGVATANTSHAGWVKIGDRYTDADGNVRQKSEVLVAMSSITGDADDDAQLPDA